MVLAAALVLLLIGGLRAHKIYDADTEEFGLVAFTRISDRQLTEDATFGGVARKGVRLYTTYDRSVPRGKQPCPT